MIKNRSLRFCFADVITYRLNNNFNDDVQISRCKIHVITFNFDSSSLRAHGKAFFFEMLKSLQFDFEVEAFCGGVYELFVCDLMLIDLSCTEVLLQSLNVSLFYIFFSK